MPRLLVCAANQARLRSGCGASRIERSEAAVGVSSRRLDLDHIRTEVGQELAAGPADRLRQIQHPIGLKGLGTGDFMRRIIT